MGPELAPLVDDIGCGATVATKLSVVRVASALLPTEVGVFRIAGYRSLVSSEEFVVLSTGELRHDVDTLVRIQSQCITGEVFGSLKCDCAAQLRSSMRMIQQVDCGVIVYQFQEGRGIGIVNKIRAYALQDKGADTVEANEQLGFPADLRDYRECAEILLDLDLHRVRLISSNPHKVRGLEEAGLLIVERVPLEVATSEAVTRYLRTKEEKLGHLLNGAPGA